MEAFLYGYGINGTALRRYQRIRRLRRERIRKCAVAAGAVCATLLLIFICFISYGSLNSSAVSGFKYYTSVTVEAGESLWDLAGEYADDVHYAVRDDYIAEVCRINHLADKDSITAGQTLILPYYSPDYVR